MTDLSLIERRFPRSLEQIRAGISAGWQRGIQIAVQLDGELLLNTGIGQTADGVPLSADSLMTWLSAGKPLTAVAVMQAIDNGQLRLDTPIAEVIPDFARNGKGQITIWHLLTHTAGLAPVRTGWPRASWNEIIATIEAGSLRPDWSPGERAAYDPAQSWFLLGELVRRVTGHPIAQKVRDEICRPLGMEDAWLEMSPELINDYRGRLSTLEITTSRGSLPPGHNDLAAGIPCSPGSSLRARAQDLVRFYEALLHNGASILSNDAVNHMTARQRTGLRDETFLHEIDFGLGLILDSNHAGVETVPYGFGRHSSPGTFGHGGAQCSMAFADPQHRLIVAWAANGCPGEVIHQRRNRDLNSAIYEDLELAG